MKIQTSPDLKFWFNFQSSPMISQYNTCSNRITDAWIHKNRLLCGNLQLLLHPAVNKRQALPCKEYKKSKYISRIKRKKYPALWSTGWEDFIWQSHTTQCHANLTVAKKFYVKPICSLMYAKQVLSLVSISFLFSFTNSSYSELKT